MSKRFSELTDAGTLTGAEDVALSRESSTSYTATTISFAASDNSINDSGGLFISEGFTQGASVRVSGASNGVNNIYTGRISTITTAKIVIAAPEGDAIIDESAGASVTITLLESVRTTVADIAGAASTDASAVTYTPADTDNWDGSSDPGNVNGALDELAARVVAIETAPTGGGNYNVGWFFTTTPTSSEVLLLHTFAEAVSFADDFAGSVGDVGTNPASSFVLTVQKNGSSVGTVTISTGGAFTFATTGGTVDFAVGDQIRVNGPSSADAAVANVSITFLGTKS